MVLPLILWWLSCIVTDNTNTQHLNQFILKCYRNREFGEKERSLKSTVSSLPLFFWNEKWSPFPHLLLCWQSRWPSFRHVRPIKAKRRYWNSVLMWIAISARNFRHFILAGRVPMSRTLLMIHLFQFFNKKYLNQFWLPTKAPKCNVRRHQRFAQRKIHLELTHVDKVNCVSLLKSTSHNSTYVYPYKITKDALRRSNLFC